MIVREAKEVIGLRPFDINFLKTEGLSQLTQAPMCLNACRGSTYSAVKISSNHTELPPLGPLRVSHEQHEAIQMSMELSMLASKCCAMNVYSSQGLRTLKAFETAHVHIYVLMMCSFMGASP